MRALSIEHAEITPESLLQMAEKTPGAWIGIRIAGCLLILSGWRSSQVASLFGLTRWAVVKWIHKVNDDGLEGVKNRVRPGRPSLFDERIKQELDQALSKSPKEFGIPRVRWDGVVVAEYLKRHHGIRVHIRHAQRWIRRLGYSLRVPVYRYAQASDDGVEEFRRQLKKTAPGAGKRGEKSHSV